MKNEPKYSERKWECGFAGEPLDTLEKGRTYFNFSGTAFNGKVSEYFNREVNAENFNSAEEKLRAELKKQGFNKVEIGSMFFIIEFVKKSPVSEKSKK